ncbi:MAG: YbaK/EbsC family protein [Caldilineaceae bacterium]
MTDLLGPDDLAAFLLVHAPEAMLVRDLGDTPTVPAAATALGVETDQIVKTLLFLVEEASGPSMVVVVGNGERRVDKGLLAAHLGVSKKRLALAPAHLVAAQLGYAVGGVPPFGHRSTLPVLLDGSVTTAAERYGGILYGGGGDDRTMMRLPYATLLRLCAPTILPLSAAATASAT